MQILSVVALTLTLFAVGFTQQLPQEENERTVVQKLASEIDLTNSQVEEVRDTGFVEVVIAAVIERITDFIVQLIGTGWRDTNICGTTCQIKYQTQICRWQLTYKTHIRCSGISDHKANCFKNKRNSVREATARTVRSLIAAGKTCTQG
ncbi:hypothetical protein BV898_06250 [Hypsibius exemplaris]|uniref:Uncharacterized protein n=1 Tax=Hypsibius exemplaris TaxID=2072580 RepID=A0A1W0WWW9_HYPEX|nr:hypothetical protein BV898_06250 [Hypsibius exemplaris]